jgi:hypothetical protein
MPGREELMNECPVTAPAAGAPDRFEVRACGFDWGVYDNEQCVWVRNYIGPKSRQDAARAIPQIRQRAESQERRNTRGRSRCLIARDKAADIIRAGQGRSEPDVRLPAPATREEAARRSADDPLGRVHVLTDRDTGRTVAEYQRGRERRSR